MNWEDEMRLLADFVGRALARRWLRRSGLAPRPEAEPWCDRGEFAEVDNRRPSQGSTSPEGQS